MSSLCKRKKVSFNLEKNEYFYIPKNIKNNLQEFESMHVIQNQDPGGYPQTQCVKMKLENKKIIFMKHNGLFI